MSCIKKFPAVVQLGKFGDIACILPALKWVFDTTGQKQKLVVSEAFANILDGVSYVDPVPTIFQWPHGTEKAKQFAELTFGECVVPQFWNADVAIPSGSKTIRIGNRHWNIDEKEYPNYMAAMWRRLGFSVDDMKALPLVFDRRSEQREKLLVERHIHKVKPTILFNFKSGSSPFPYEPEVWKGLEKLQKEFHFVDLGNVISERIYDLIGLMDAAAGMITCATATLHLACASNIPYVALTEDHWSHAVPKGNCVLEVKYGEAERCVEEIAEKISQWQIKKTFNTEDPPSIKHQTKWECKFFDFSKSGLPTKPGTDYFNCGLVVRPDGDWLIVRRSEWRANMQFGVNDLIAFKLHEMIPQQCISLGIVKTDKEEHFEDPRAVFHNGQTLISCTNFIWGKIYTGAHQVTAWFDNDWRLISRHDPIFGNNGGGVKLNRGSEKNWLWFFRNETPHMIYQTFPHVVSAFNEKFQSAKVYETLSQNFHWPYGQPRGGTPPVLIGNEYWTFFHSSDHSSIYSRRRYHMGAYAFEASPPFSMTRMTQFPLLSGSAFDRGGDSKPLVVFPCGAIFRDGVWTVTFGVNDIDCAYIKIPHEELIKKTNRVEFSFDKNLTRVLC